MEMCRGRTVKGRKKKKQKNSERDREFNLTFSQGICIVGVNFRLLKTKTCCFITMHFMFLGLGMTLEELRRSGLIFLKPVQLPVSTLPSRNFFF